MSTRNKKKTWSEMSTKQRLGTLVAIVIQLALLTAALADIRRRPAEQINGSKRMWAGLAFINVIGPLAYFIFGRKR